MTTLLSAHPYLDLFAGSLLTGVLCWFLIAWANRQAFLAAWGIFFHRGTAR